MYLIILFLSSKYSSNLTERCSLTIIFNPSYAFSTKYSQIWIFMRIHAKSVFCAICEQFTSTWGSRDCINKSQFTECVSNQHNNCHRNVIGTLKLNSKWQSGRMTMLTAAHGCVRMYVCMCLCSSAGTPLASIQLIKYTLNAQTFDNKFVN